MTPDAEAQHSTAPEGAPAAPAEPEFPDEQTGKRAITLVLVAAFMTLMDVSIVNIAIPTIQTDLEASFAEIQLIVALYQVAYAAALVTGGRLGDIVGVRTMFLTGVAMFTVASLLCAAADSPEQLIAFRILQGASAALMFPQVLATIQIMLRPERRAGALAALGAVTIGATIFGPLIGGLIIDDVAADASWRFIFLVNIPVGIAALFLGRKLVPPTRQPDSARLDLTSVAVLTAALVCVMLPLTLGREHDWPVWSWIMLAAAPFLLALFVPLQQRLAAAGRKPLLPPSLWHDRAFRRGVSLYVLFFIGMVPFFLYYSYVLQFGVGIGPLDTGLALTPYAVAAVFTSILSRKLLARWGPPRVASTGALTCALGTALMIPVILGVGDSSLPWVMLVPMSITGAGLGLVIAPLLVTILMNIRSTEAGASSGLLGTAQQIGGAFGVATLGFLVLQGRTTETIATMSYDDLTDGFAAACGAIVLVFVVVGVLIASLRPQETPQPAAPGEPAPSS